MLLTAIGGSVVANALIALSTSYALTLAVRFCAGTFAGLLWGLAAGYAARMVPKHLQGRAIAVVMVGVPIALSVGTPAGTFLGDIFSWRIAFGVMSVCALLLIGWVLLKVPNFPGQSAARRLSVRTVLTIPGIRSVLFVTLTFQLAQTILYSYIAPFVRPAGLGNHVDVVLLVFGVAALFGTWVAGALVDRWLRALVLASTLGFILIAVALGLWGDNATVVYVAVGIWGLAFGGTPTLLQTASAKTAGEAADVAQSMIVTVWNSAIAGGGIVGGVLLETTGVTAFPWVLLVLLMPALIAAWLAKKHGFPAHAGAM